jgi:glycosyltransferase involved in cell wall biosynthesis
VQWHVITGEYPPQPGGVSDYTHQVAKELAKAGDLVHVWSPTADGTPFPPDAVELHPLPPGFGWSWLRELNRRLRSYTGPRTILIQYVPHMYGWKSMNLAFCFWICIQRKHHVYVMFHEVAFPFRSGQRFRHRLLAIVHRVMASAILRSVEHSFTSTEAYLDLLQRLGSKKTPVSMLRIWSNIPFEAQGSDIDSAQQEEEPSGLFTVGIFSNFGAELCEILDPVIGALLVNPKIALTLLGPGEGFRQLLARRYPATADRIRSTGRLYVSDFAGHMRNCDALLQVYPEGAAASRGTLIGALASGVPVVTTSGSATDQFLVESKTMLFSGPAPESIAEALELLMANSIMAREMGARAQRLYRESFQPAVIVSRLRGQACGFKTDMELPNSEAVISGHLQSRF